MSWWYHRLLASSARFLLHGWPRCIPHPSTRFKSSVKPLSVSHWHATLKAAQHLTKLKSYALFTHVACPGLRVRQWEGKGDMKKWVMNIKYRGGSVMASTVSVLTGFIVTASVQGLSRDLKRLRGELPASHFLRHENLPLTHSTYAYTNSIVALKDYQPDLVCGKSIYSVSRTSFWLEVATETLQVLFCVTLIKKVSGEHVFFPPSEPFSSGEP